MSAADVRAFLELLAAQMWSMRAGEMPKGYNFSGIQDFVADQGVTYAGARLSAEHLAIVHRAIDRCSHQFRVKQCFYNAQSLALADETRTLRYVEGFAQGRAVIAVNHAWVTIGDTGAVVDLTWRLAPEDEWRSGRMRDRPMGEVPEGWAYIGTLFDTDLIRDRWLATGQSVSMLDNWEDHYPVLKRERRNAKPDHSAFDTLRQWT